MNSTLKYVLYGLGGLVILGIILYVFVFYKGTISVNPTPISAKITINNQTVSGATNFRLNPGNYNVKIEAEGYVTYEKKFALGSTKTIKLSVALNKIPQAKSLAQGTQFLAKGDQENLMYLDDGGKTLYKMERPSGEAPEIIAITPAAMTGMSNIFWAPLRDVAVIKKTSETSLYDFKRYDLLHQETTAWPQGIGDITWSPDGKYVFYYFNPQGGEKTLIRADRTNTNLERFYNLKDSAISNPKLRWSSDGKNVLVVTSDIYILDTYTKNLTKLTENENVTDANFSPDSNWIIYSNQTGLFLLDLLGKNKRDLQTKTSLDKIVWTSNSKSFIAAVPTSTSSDRLFKVNIDSGERKEIFFDNSLVLNAFNLTLLSDEKILYFISNSNIYSLDISNSEY